MARKKTFCERDFSTIFLRVVWISETSCKSLSINDLQAQGAPPRKYLTINNLQMMIFDTKLNESKRSEASASIILFTI